VVDSSSDADEPGDFRLGSSASAAQLEDAGYEGHDDSDGAAPIARYKSSDDAKEQEAGKNRKSALKKKLKKRANSARSDSAAAAAAAAASVRMTHALPPGLVYTDGAGRVIPMVLSQVNGVLYAVPATANAASAGARAAPHPLAALAVAPPSHAAAPSPPSDSAGSRSFRAPPAHRIASARGSLDPDPDRAQASLSAASASTSSAHPALGARALPHPQAIPLLVVDATTTAQTSNRARKPSAQAQQF